MPEITPRQFFAAHAPPEVPDWFKVNPLPRPAQPEIPAVLAPYDKPVRHWMREYDQPLDVYLPDTATSAVLEAAAQFEKEWAAWHADRQRISRLDQERTYAKWRWYYADLVLSYQG
jgi:hypothetical protein